MLESQISQVETRAKDFDQLKQSIVDRRTKVEDQKTTHEQQMETRTMTFEEKST